MDGQTVNLGRDLTHPFVNAPHHPPPASASYDERAAWSERYVTWFIEQTPMEGALPPDVSPTHRYRVEFISCVIDPQKYYDQTEEELRPEAAH